MDPKISFTITLATLVVIGSSHKVPQTSKEVSLELKREGEGTLAVLQGQQTGDIVGAADLAPIMNVNGEIR